MTDNKINTLSASTDLLNNMNTYCDLSMYSCNIAEAIAEIAQTSTDMYSSDLWEWARENQEVLSQFIKWYGLCGDDIQLTIQQAQAHEYEEEMFNNVHTVLKAMAYDFIGRELKIVEINETTDNKLEELLDNVNIYEDTVEEVQDRIAKLIKELI